MEINKGTFTAGHGGSRLASYIDIVRYHLRGNDRLARETVERAKMVKQYADSQTSPRVLDLGCGGRGGIVLPLHSLGISATGIDYDVVSPRFSPAGWWAVARCNGAERALKTIGRQVLFDYSFYKHMRRRLGCELRWNGLDVRRMDARALQFDSESFSFIFSAAAFEHIADVEAATAEMRRVLRDEGMAYIRIHLFPSLSGGHALDWADADEDAPPITPVPPWDHLRERRFPPHVYLNQLRSDDFMEIFSRHFSVLEVMHDTEGYAHLTPEIRHELANWSEEDLTRRNLTVLLSA